MSADSAGKALAERLAERRAHMQPPAAIEDPDAALDDLLSKHAVVLFGGTARIVGWKKRALFPGDECMVVNLIAEAAFKTFYRHLYVLAPLPHGGQTRVPLAGKFLDHAERFHGLVFAPGEDRRIDGCLNLWQGFGVRPWEGDWSLLENHIHEVLAGNNAAYSDYILKWAAWSVQNPGRPAEVVLVLRGGKGTGKGVFGRALRQIFGTHGLHISSRKHLIGTFNMHLAHCALLFADEAFWPGDKAGEGELKRLVTEPSLTIEPKGIDAFEVRNCLHVVMASNADWVVPASHDERRFAVFDVSANRQGDLAYFENLYAEIESGGLSAMLYDLLATDLKGWHPRQNVPQTAALAKQQLHSRDGVDALIEDLAHVGVLPDNVPGKPHVANILGANEGRGLWAYVRRNFPGLRHATPTELKAGLRRDWGCNTDWHSSNRRGVEFPPLDELRTKFDAKYGPQDWSQAATEWSEGEND